MAVIESLVPRSFSTARNTIDRAITASTGACGKRARPSAANESVTLCAAVNAVTVLMSAPGCTESRRPLRETGAVKNMSETTNRMWS